MSFFQQNCTIYCYRNITAEKYFSYLRLKQYSPKMWAQKRQWIPHKMNYRHPCWTVGAIFTFVRSRMFGPEKLRPSVVAVAKVVG